MNRARALALVLRFTGAAFIVVFALLFLASVTRTDTPPPRSRPSTASWGGS